MTRRKRVENDIRSRWGRGTTRLGALCGVLTIITLTTGCPFAGDACTDFDTDDDNICTEDSCAIVDGEATAVNDPIEGCCTTDADCDQGFCSEQGGKVCVECVTDAQCDDSNDCTTDACDSAACTNEEVEDGTACDDGDACTEGDLCAAGECSATDVECPDDQECNPDTGECEEIVPPCAEDVDCDDEDGCTIDTCDVDTGECSYADVPCDEGEGCVDGECVTACTDDEDCDDGVDCTNDTCDEASGSCENADNCPAGQVCNFESGDCQAEESCDSDNDCPDDGLFCSGPEKCVNGVCRSAGNPCDAGETCDETLNDCVAEVDDLFFTLAIETVTGSAGADIFQAPLASNLPTLQTGDAGLGGDGIDSLNATFNFTSVTTVQPTLTGIENITVTDVGTAATTLSATGITGAASIHSQNSTSPTALIVSNLANLVDIGLINTSAGFTVSYLAAATAGAADAMDVALSNTNGGALTVATASANGIESLNLLSEDSPNTLSAITQTTGTTLATLTVTGESALTVTGALPASVATVNAAGAAGGATIDVSANTGNVTATGGAGNDTFSFGSNYSSTDQVTGGAGTNTLAMTSAAAGAAVSNQTNVTGVTALTLTDGLSGNVTTTWFTQVSTVNLRPGFTGAGNLTVGSGTSMNLGSPNASTDSVAAGMATVSGTGTSDTVTLAVNDHDTLGLAFAGVETLNLQSNNRGDGNAADNAVNLINGALTLTPTSGTGTINVTGAANLTVAGAVTAGTLSATGFTGNLVMQTAAAGAIVINSGAGNDTLFGSSAADTLNGGAGANVFEGRAGADSLTLGAGVDTVRIFAAGGDGVDRKQVLGFTAGVGGDVVNVDGDGLATLDGSDNFTTAASIQPHSAVGVLSIASPTEVVRVTSGTVSNFTEANSLNGTNLLAAIGGAITTAGADDEILFVVADASGNTGVYFGDSGFDISIAANELMLVGVLLATPVANMVFSNFSNVN